MLRSIIFCGFLLILSAGDISGSPRILSYQDLIDEIITTQDTIYRLSNAIIRLNTLRDTRFIIADSLQAHRLNFKDTLTVNSSVELHNVHFEDIAIFERIHFKKPVAFKQITGKPWLTFDSCTFDANVSLTDVEPWIFITRSIFSGNLTHINSLAPCKLKITESQFLANATSLAPTGINTRLLAVGFNQQGSYFELWDTDFAWTSARDQIILWGDHGMVSLLRNTFNIPIVLGAAVGTGFEFYENHINKLVSFEYLLFSPDIAFAPWKQFDGHKLAIGGAWNNPEFYQAHTDTELLEPTRYALLAAAYSKLLNIYSRFGDTDSYNACYIELKNLETRRLNLQYKATPDFTILFTWLLSVFMREFSNYGTSPALALVFSLKVITLFAVIYFFMPNTWDSLGRDKLILRLNQMVALFREPHGATSIFFSDESPRMQKYEEFCAELASAQDELPTLYRVVAKPLYFLSILGHQAINKVLHHVDIFKGKWSELTPVRQGFIAILAMVYLLLYLIGHVILHALNALMISLNAFSTLGFGEIPVGGASRYLAVCEGLVGWFMLTIFSVSLIGQLLR